MVKHAPFDPCRQWLGIDALRLGDARAVLGVTAGEMDPRVVTRAADARLDLLRAISPGPFELARTSLIRRVEEARDNVLAEIAAVPARPAAAAGFAMPAPPSGRQAAAPAVPERFAGVPAVPSVVVPATPPVPPAVPGAASYRTGGQPSAPEQIRIRTTVYRKRIPVAGIVLSILALAGMAGALAYLYVENGKQRLAKREQAEADAAERRAAEEAAAVADRRPTAKASRREAMPSSDAAVSSSPPPDRRRERPRPAPPSPPVPDNALDAIAAMPDAPPAVASMEKPGERPAARPRMQAEPPPDAMAAAPDAAMQPSVGGPPASAPRMGDSPEMKPDTKPDAKPDTNPDTKKLDATLAEVLAAMRTGADDTADGRLSAASALVKGSRLGADAASRVASWRQLATYYKGFMGFRAQALAAVAAGDEYEVRNQKIAVVEVDDEVFKYRVAGETRSSPRDKIPAGIVLAIVMAWFDANPANDLYVGAYHLGKPESDAKRAREHWLKAESAGADASSLLPLLDDPVFATAAGDE